MAAQGSGIEAAKAAWKKHLGQVPVPTEPTVLQKIWESVNSDSERKALLDVRHGLGGTAMHWACQHGRGFVVSWLDYAKADLNAQDWNGWTPLHWACDHGHVMLVSYLLRSGVNDTLQSTQEFSGHPAGSTALDVARRNNNAPIIRMLEHHHNPPASAGAGTASDAAASGVAAPPPAATAAPTSAASLQAMIEDRIRQRDAHLAAVERLTAEIDGMTRQLDSLSAAAATGATAIATAAAVV